MGPAGSRALSVSLKNVNTRKKKTYLIQAEQHDDSLSCSLNSCWRLLCCVRSSTIRLHQPVEAGSGSWYGSASSSGAGSRAEARLIAGGAPTRLLVLQTC